jgi:hypothetical protein
MATSSEVFHFDEFTLDVRERRLLRGTEDRWIARVRARPL